VVEKHEIQWPPKRLLDFQEGGGGGCSMQYCSWFYATCALLTGPVCCTPYLPRLHQLLLESQYTSFHFVSSAKAGEKWNSAVDTATYVTRSKFRCSHIVRDRIFIFSPKLPDRPCRPRSFLFSGYRGSFPAVKQPGREVDHLTISNAEISCRNDIEREKIMFTKVDSSWSFVVYEMWW